MSDIKGIFSSGGTAWPELNWVVTDSLTAATEADEDSGRFDAPDPADVAFLQYTSGMERGDKGEMQGKGNVVRDMNEIQG